MQPDVIVVGAGFAGCTAARALAEAGRKVLVVEKRSHLAGNCHDYRNEAGITIHQYGPHIFHTNSKAIWDFANRFSAFNHFQHRVLSYAEGRLLPFPINRDTVCEVFGVDISVNEVHDFLAEEVAKATFSTPPANFRDQVVSQVGERLYALFFKEYTRKQWNREPEELSAEVAARIPVRENRDPRYFSDRYQGIPLAGYTGMATSMLRHENITVMTGTDWHAIRADLPAARIVYTGKLDEFFKYQHGELEYRSVRFEFETLQMAQFQPVSVVNYPNDYDFTRITEFKHFTGETSPVTTILREYPSAEGEPSYVVLTPENLRKRDLYLAEMAREELGGRLVFVGRLAEYRYYNMDQVIEAALSKVKRLMA